MKRLAILPFFLLASHFALADEILPAAMDSEDLKSFDQSIVVQPQAGVGQAVKAEARKLRDASKPVNGTATQFKKFGAGASETNPSSGVRNSAASHGQNSGSASANSNGKGHKK